MEPSLAPTRLFERLMLWLALLASPLAFGGCRVIGGIFKAGFWVGAIVVIVIVVIIGGIVTAFTRGGRGGGAP